MIPVRESESDPQIGPQVIARAEMIRINETQNSQEWCRLHEKSTRHKFTVTLSFTPCGDHSVDNKPLYNEEITWALLSQVYC